MHKLKIQQTGRSLWGPSMDLHIGNNTMVIASKTPQKHVLPLEIAWTSKTSTLGWRDVIRTDEIAKELQVTHALERQLKAKYSK